MSGFGLCRKKALHKPFYTELPNSSSAATKERCQLTEWLPVLL
jgi:hypothetical protein